MDAPPVRYVMTTDGYSIAYMEQGEGRPVVFLPGSWSHIQLWWTEESLLRPWLQGLAELFCLVQYDGRGQGLSTRGLSDTFSLYDLELDLEAVVERLGLRRFTLFAYQAHGHAAIRYAAENPARVDALILVSTMISHADFLLTSGLDRLAEQDWDAYLRALAGLGTRRDVEASARRLKEAGTRPDHLIVKRALDQSNIEAWLPRLTMPTLVLHPRQSVTLAPEEAMRLAAAIPNAQLVLIDGASPLGDPQQGLAAVERFLEGIPSSGVSMSLVAPTSANLGGLSAREVEVLRLLAAGKSNALIADELVISQNTVIRHVSNIFAKIGAENRTEAASYAHRHGLT